MADWPEEQGGPDAEPKGEGAWCLIFFSGLKPLDRPAAVETVEMICRTW